MNRYLLPSSTYRSLLCSLFCLACLIAPSASAAQDPPPPAAASKGMHIIILIDTSTSMLKLMEAKEGGKKARIDAIKAPLSEMIDAIKIDQKNAENNTTLHIYEFSEGAGKLYKTRLFSEAKCDQLMILIKDENNRKEAKRWVEKDLSAKGPNRPTWLYTSIDQVLTDAEKLQEADPSKPISFMVISDGEDSETKGKFKNMAAVLKKHGKTFNKLKNKYFIELVGFNNEGKEEWEIGGGTVVPPKGMKALAEVARTMAVPKRIKYQISNGIGKFDKEIWAIKKEGINVKFTNDSNGTLDGKAIPLGNLKYEWKCEIEFRNKWMFDWGDVARIPKPRLFTEGKYKITLTVSFRDLEAKKEKFFSVHEFKGPNIAGDLEAQKPIAGEEVVIKFDKYPDGIAGIKGSTFIINHGDGKTTKGNENTEKVGITYGDAGDYQTIIILTLPGGESIEIPGPAIAVKNPTGEIIVSKNDPWIGEKVKFQSLYPIPAGVKAVYTWDLGDGMVKAGKKVEGHYQTSGKKNVKLTIQIAGLKAKVVAMFPPGEELVVKGINVQIGVGP